MISGRRFLLAASAYLGLLLGSANAHPHVFIGVESRIAFDPAGAPQSLAFRWSYDAAYTAFALRELGFSAPSPEAGEKLGRDQLQKLNLVSFFTKVAVDGRDVPLKDATLAAAELGGDGGLIISVVFDLRAAGPGRQLSIEVLDPSFLAYFTVSEPSAVSLASAPLGCVATASGPKPLNLKDTASVPAAFWAALDGSAADQKNFANKVLITCP